MFVLQFVLSRRTAVKRMVPRRINWEWIFKNVVIVFCRVQTAHGSPISPIDKGSGVEVSGFRVTE
jgi:hypothetical protein